MTAPAELALTCINERQQIGFCLCDQLPMATRPKPAGSDGHRPSNPSKRPAPNLRGAGNLKSVTGPTLPAAQKSGSACPPKGDETVRRRRRGIGPLAGIACRTDTSLCDERNISGHWPARCWPVVVVRHLCPLSGLSRSFPTFRDRQKATRRVPLQRLPMPFRPSLVW